jgi:integrase
VALITTTKNGRPQYRVRWNYRRENGRLVYDEKRFSDKRQAVAAHNQLAAVDSTRTETITVAELAALWLAQHVTPNCSLRTQKDYRCHYHKRIAPRLANKRVSALTPRVMAQWRDWMVARGTGARTVNKSLDVVKAMVRWGRSEGLCTNTGIDDVRRVREPRPAPANPYTPAQVQQLADGCEYLRDATLLKTAAYTGLRWSELRALRWVDIDLDAATVDLRRALDMNGKAKATKSNTERIVPILQPGVDALRLWREHAPDVSLVFPNERGGHLTENWYDRRLTKIRKASGIDIAGLHELRDTYASILIQSGIGEAELALWLGHRSIQTTLDRYAKLFERRKAVLVARANAALGDL